MTTKQTGLVFSPSPEQVKAAEAQIVEQSKRIEFYLTDYSIELLANKMRNGDFVIPPYQREDIWEPKRKSRFIESLLMGLSIPFLFFWEKPGTGQLEIVDGSQRLRTIEQFVLGDLRIGELNVLTQLEGIAFADLPESRQRKIKNRPIRGIVLNEHADEQARFDIFERINTGPKVAKPAEVRRGAFPGPFMDLVVELAKVPLFAELAPVPIKTANQREREELVTRFFAYGDGLEGYKDKPTLFLFNYAKRMNAEFSADPAKVDVYRERFMTTMEFIRRNFPIGFRKSPNATTTRHARFEAIAVGCYLAIAERPDLAEQQVDVTEWLADEDFAKLTRSDSSNPIASLRARLGYFREKLVGA